MMFKTLIAILAITAWTVNADVHSAWNAHKVTFLKISRTFENVKIGIIFLKDEAQKDFQFSGRGDQAQDPLFQDPRYDQQAQQQP